MNDPNLANSESLYWCDERQIAQNSGAQAGISNPSQTMESVGNTLISRSSAVQQTDRQEVNLIPPTNSAFGQTTQRSNGKSTDATTLEPRDTPDDEKSLAEKLRDHYYGRPLSDSKTKTYARFLFQFQGITQLYMTMAYIVPYLFADYSDMTQYYFKIFVCYVFFMTQANWLCAICYTSYLPDVKDRPNLDYNNWFENPPTTFGENGQIHNHDTTDKNGLKWHFCATCNRYGPPRARHCNYCKTCILRRDHHCYLVGNCIGHYNQRYFIVLCFLMIVVCTVGFPMTVFYLSSLPGAEWWAHYAFPYTFIRFVCGEVSWQFLLLTFHCLMLVVFGVMSVIYFLSQLSIVAMGKTLFEVAKQVDMRITSSTSDNFRLVFGDYWLVNFLFPAQIIFKQRHDGMLYEGVKIYEDPENKK